VLTKHRGDDKTNYNYVHTVRTQPRRNSIVRERTLRVPFWNGNVDFFFFLSLLFFLLFAFVSTAAVQRCVRAIALLFFCSVSSRLLLLLLPLCVSYPLFAFGRVPGSACLFLTDLFASPLSLLGWSNDLTTWHE
jgi:hypothetical protein